MGGGVDEGGETDLRGGSSEFTVDAYVVASEAAGSDDGQVERRRGHGFQRPEVAGVPCTVFRQRA